MISLILPIYNVEEYLNECLESILNQSYCDYELLIVDDGSTDSSLHIARGYSEKFKDIKVFTQENKGVSEARNLALKNAKGDYILFIDSDDFLRKDMLEKLIETALESNSDITISNYYLYYNKNNFKEFIKGMPKYNLYTNSEVIEMMLKHKLQGQLWNKLFKTSLLKEINFQFEKGRYIQDIFPIFRAVSASKKIAYINEALYFYRQREESTVHKRNKKLTEDYYHAMTSIIDYVNGNKIEVKKKSLRIFKVNVFSYFIYHYTNENLSNSYRTFKNSIYLSLNMQIKEILFLKGVNIRHKLRIVLWKLGIFNFLKKVKKSYE